LAEACEATVANGFELVVDGAENAFAVIFVAKGFEEPGVGEPKDGVAVTFVANGLLLTGVEKGDVDWRPNGEAEGVALNGVEAVLVVGNKGETVGARNGDVVVAANGEEKVVVVENGEGVGEKGEAVGCGVNGD